MERDGAPDIHGFGWAMGAAARLIALAGRVGANPLEKIDLATALGMDVPDMSSGPQPPAAPERRPRQSPAAKRHRD